MTKHNENIRKVSKLDVVIEQLSDAIYLDITGGSSISIHTLIMNSYQIIYDMLDDEHEEKISSIINFNNPMFKEGKAKEFIKKIREPMNFFKHADKDSGDILDFYYKENEFMFMIALNSLFIYNPELYKTRLDLHIFYKFLCKKNPDLYEDRIPDGEDEKEDAIIHRKIMDSIDVNNLNQIYSFIINARKEYS